MMIHSGHRLVALFAPLIYFSVVYSPADSSGSLWRQPQGVLAPGVMIEREIGGDEKHFYSLPLTAGQFASIVVEQDAVDAVLVLLKPDGQPSAEADNYPQHEHERLSLVAETDGAYQLKISAADPGAARASYKIRVEDWRAATPRDSQFVDAERKFSDATRLLRRGKADSLPQAATIYGDALQRWRELGERHYEMKTLIHLGVVNERQNKFQRFIELYAQALPIARELRDRRYEARSLSGIGWGWHNLGEYQKALEYYQPALTIRQSLGISRDLAQTLTAIALIQTEMGEANLALDAYQQSLPLAHASGDKTMYAFTLSSMAWLHIKLNEHQRAISMLQESLALFREIGNDYGVARALNMMGAAYSNLFDAQNALSYYIQSIELAEKTGNRYGAAQTLNNLGILHYLLHDYDQALACYERALAYWREIGNRPEEFRTLCNLGLLYNEKGDTDKSLEIFKTALGDRVNGRYLRTDAGLLNNIALSHLNRGEIKQTPEEFQLALEWYQRALPLIRENRDLETEVRALAGKAETHLMLNQPELALKESDRAVALAEKIRTEIAGPEHRVLSQQWMALVYKMRVHSLMELHQGDPSAGYDILALRAIEQCRLRTLIELLSESRIELSHGVGAEYLARLKELQLKLESAENRRAQSLNRKQSEKLAEVEKEMAELLRQRDLLDADIRVRHPQYAALKMPSPLSPSEIQRELLDDETILLEYMLGRTRAYLWLVTADSISSYRIPHTQKINQAARRVRELLTSQNQPPEGETLKEKHARQLRRKAEFDQAASELSQMILGPVAGKLGKKRLLIVGDGILQYIPFGVLPEPKSGGTGEDGATGRRGDG
ncbi:MAG TPA: tetratricopeptide repeat protein, partial [Blastocatellia bacterium]|nr:tetratricopeptide repeat protein [Blastocatellia bacterium]